MRIYRIADWAKYYEVSDSKKVSGPLQWVPVRTKTDGFGYARITQQKDRSDLLAAWYLMLGIAAKQPKGERGILARNGIALTPEDMELMTRFPAAIFDKALKFYSDPKQGWLVYTDTSDPIRIDPDEPGCPPEESESSGPTGQDRTGQNSIAPTSSTRRKNPLFDALVAFEGLPENFNDREGGKIGRALKSIRQSTPGVTPEEIQRRGAAYLADMRVKPTALGLAGNWSKYAESQKTEGLLEELSWEADGR